MSHKGERQDGGARFDIDRMPVYGLARQLNAECAALARRVAARRGDLADQLGRAAASVPLNIAEGAGEFRPREKARFYRFARRSATECAGILDAVADTGLATETSVAPLRELAGRVAGQLVLLGKAIEAAGQARPRGLPPPPLGARERRWPPVEVQAGGDAAEVGRSAARPTEGEAEEG